MAPVRPAQGMESDVPVVRLQLAGLCVIGALMFAVLGSWLLAGCVAFAALGIAASCAPWWLRLRAARRLIAELEVTRADREIEVTLRLTEGARLERLSLAVLQTTQVVVADHDTGETLTVRHQELQSHELSGPLQLAPDERRCFRATLSELPSLEQVRAQDRGEPGKHPRVFSSLELEVRAWLAHARAPIRRSFSLLEPDPRR